MKRESLIIIEKGKIVIVLTYLILHYVFLLLLILKKYLLKLMEEGIELHIKDLKKRG